MTTIIFTQNKYHNWYYAIINKAQLENRRKKMGVYYERHHILPSSLFPESKKDKSNLVLLTAREHFICHRLLTKFTTGHNRHKMVNALMMFKCEATFTKRTHINSKLYESIRKDFAKSLSENHPNRGKDVLSDAGRLALSISSSRPRTQEWKDNIGLWHKGKTHTEEAKEKIRIKRQEQENDPIKKARMMEGRKDLSFKGELNPFYGKLHTEENIIKNRIAHSDGTYITPWGMFLSARDSSKNAPFKISPITINKWCKINFLITKNPYRNSYSFDCGFGFQPKILE